MKPIKTIEDRIVTLQKVTADGVDWDFSNQRFSTEIGGVIFHSTFDYKDYISEPWQHGKNYVRSSRRK